MRATYPGPWPGSGQATCRNTIPVGLGHLALVSAKSSEKVAPRKGWRHTSANALSELNTLEKCRVTSAAKSCAVECAANSSFSSAVGSRRESVRYAETIPVLLMNPGKILAEFYAQCSSR